MPHLLNRLILALFVFLALQAPPLQAAKLHALLIGVNYRGADPNIPPLDGAVADAEGLYRLMTGPLGIPQEQIRILTETHATRGAILSQIQEWLVAGTAPGDDVFLMFAGHGVQVPNPLGDQAADPDKRQESAPRAEVDLFGQRRSSLNLSEALVPYDTRMDVPGKAIDNLILDTEIYQLLTQLDGRRVTLWLDNCHAGGATRDLGPSRFRPRQLTLPWAVAETQVTGVPTGRLRGIRGFGRVAEKQEAPYRYFAAAHYFQKANETDGHGLFTLALTQLLRAKPQARYTNAQIIAAVRNSLQYQRQMPPDTQEPVFYGPAQADNEIFSLLAHPARVEGVASTTVSPAPPTALRIRLRGEGVLADALRTAINHQSDLSLDDSRPELVLEIGPHDVTLYHPAGQRLQTLPAAMPPVLNALLAYRTAQQLGSLYNPATPFQVELWLDRPGKTRFKRNDRVTLYYRVQKLPYPRAYLTLLNLAPDGTLSRLYPQPNRDVTPSPRRLYLSAPVEPGRVHTIPQGQGALRPGENVALDLRLRLSQPGAERFKAIVTPRPLALDAVDARLLAAGLHATDAPAFAARLQQELAALATELSPAGWGVGDLRVEVEP